MSHKVFFVGSGFIPDRSKKVDLKKKLIKDKECLLRKENIPG